MINQKAIAAMIKHVARGTLAALAAVMTGCAGIRTTPANLDQAPEGVRIYPPKVVLMVDAEENRSTLAFLPDYEGAYDVKPVTILARQQFRIQLTDGQLEVCTLDQNTSAAISLVEDLADTAAEAAGIGTSMRTINGAFGLESGIYVLQRDGVFRKMITP